MLTGPDTHQHLATGFPIGERFHSAPVRRIADGRPLGLGHVARADGRWRLYLLADAARPEDAGSPASVLLDFLATSPDSPLLRAAANGSDPAAVFDMRAVYQQGNRDVSVDQLHPLLLPTAGRLGLVDYEKAFTVDPASGEDLFDVRGIDRARGALVVVRPDQYVAHVLPLDAHGELAGFFEQILRPAVPAAV
ncbi:MAG TPA: hypothetical protein VN621_11565 [Arthrobacter sp.]|nr:hypothetical protein [Arthrobacter sp.]